MGITMKVKDDYLRTDYIKPISILWSAIQYALNKIDKLEKDISKLKKDNSDNEASLKAKAKSKAKKN